MSGYMILEWRRHAELVSASHETLDPPAGGQGDLNEIGLKK